MKNLLLSLFMPAYLKVALFIIDMPEHISFCLKKGYTRMLSQLFVGHIELQLLGESNTGSTAATNALQHFFDSHQASYFTALQSNIQKKEGYLVGILNTTQEKYHVYVLLRHYNKQLLIHKIRIEHSNGSLN